MRRLTDPTECKRVTDKHPQYFTFDVEEWLANADNYALIEGDNIAFGEYKSPGLYWVHFCFHTARGREAIELTKRMFDEFCKACPVKTAIGFIEMRNKPARWLIRQAGFASLGEIETENGLCEMFYKTSTRVD